MTMSSRRRYRRSFSRLAAMALTTAVLGCTPGGGPPDAGGSGAGGGTGGGGGGSTAFDAGAQILGPVTGFITVSSAGPGRNVACTPSACYFASTLGSVPRLLSTASTLDGLPGSPAETQRVERRGADVFLGSLASGVLRYDASDGGYTQLCAAIVGASVGVDSLGNVLASEFARCPAGAAPGTPWTTLTNSQASGSLSVYTPDTAGNLYSVGDQGVFLLRAGATDWETTGFAAAFPNAWPSKLAGAPNGDLWALAAEYTVGTSWRYAAKRLPAGSAIWEDVSAGLDTEVKTVRPTRYSFAFHVDAAGNVLALTHNNSGVHSLYRLSPGATAWSLVLSGNGLPTTTSPVGVPGTSICGSMGVDGPGRLVLVCANFVYRSTP
jgi:hypothetical protein